MASSHAGGRLLARRERTAREVAMVASYLTFDGAVTALVSLSRLKPRGRLRDRTRPPSVRPGGPSIPSSPRSGAPPLRFGGRERHVQSKAGSRGPRSPRRRRHGPLRPARSPRSLDASHDRAPWLRDPAGVGLGVGRAG